MYIKNKYICLLIARLMLYCVVIVIELCCGDNQQKFSTAQLSWAALFALSSSVLCFRLVAWALQLVKL